jgi:hypothetical protein
MEAYIHNGETISLPVIAPADAPVTVKNVILNRTFEPLRLTMKATRITGNGKFKSLSIASRQSVQNMTLLGSTISRRQLTFTRIAIFVWRNLDLSKGNAGDLDIPDDSRHNVCSTLSTKTSYFGRGHD